VLNFLRELSNILIAIAPFIAILLLSGKVNLTKPKRSRQFIMPLVALVYCILIILLTDKINVKLTSIIAWISRFIPFLAKVNLTKWLNYIFNAVIAGAFLILKGIFLPVISIVWREARFLFNQTSGSFYEYNDRMNVWVLKDEFGQAKTLWKGFYWFAVGISSVILALSQVYPHWLFFKTPFYPIFGVLVMGEILFFLSGLTFQEMLTNIAGEDDQFYRIANYGILRRVFRDLFEKRILYDNTADSLFGLTSFEMLDKLAESKNTLDNVISRYFIELKERGMLIDPSFVRSSIDMVNEKSVLINTPFYQDLTGYIMLPLARRLLSFEKALVIVGRDSSAEDVKNWLHNGIAAFCGTPELWKTGILTDKETEYDAAVLRFADVYNRRILDVNKEFLNHVSFVLLIEPSRIVSTGQIGLSLIVDQIGKDIKNIVFCSCDRNCDGLVDTLSHILKVNLTKVYATVPTLANCSLMYWNAHGDYLHHKILPNIAHYLGIGTELSSVALRNQISNVVWVSSERFPVIDMRWIIGQYYNIICNYIGYPQNQEALDEVFKVDANLWNLNVNDNAFITVEDEFNNLFEMTRLYSTRAKNQGFINVISENYLLRDYMVDNALVFSSDSKVIPSIAPDYTRTERNTVVGLIMRMFGCEVSETDLKHKLSIAGIEFTDAYKKFCELVPKHSHVDAVDIVSLFKDEIDGEGIRVVKSNYYTIRNNDSKLSRYARNLSNAYFIIEDDKDKSYYLGAMLYGQVFQKYLPGQMLTYSGKYYQVQTITPESGVVLRRAADHITGRKSYRQRRNYLLSGFSLDPAMGSCRSSRGIELKRGFCDITVNTSGYYELASLDNIASAHKVDLNNIPKREYKNKAVLCVKLLGICEDVRFTIALLLNEIFITLYPESYHYITAAVKMKPDTKSKISALLSPVQLHGFDDDESIYIIEDSEIDLGLLVSVERNLIRMFEIIADFLAWHENKMAKNKDKDKDPINPEKVVNVTINREKEIVEKENTEEVNTAEDKTEEVNIAEGKTEEVNTEEDITEEVNTAEGKTEEVNTKEDITEEMNIAEDIMEEMKIEEENTEEVNTAEDKAEEINIEEEIMKEEKTEYEISAEKVTETVNNIKNEPDVTAVEPVFENNNKDLPQNKTEEKHSEYDYLFYGYKKHDLILNIKETLKFMSDHHYDKNALEQARTNSNPAAQKENEINFKKKDAHFCDFCAVELSGGEYNVLADGRERCTQCANSAMKTVEQFTRLYENALRNMETFFGIKIKVPIKVRMANAKKIAKLCGEVFVPTPGYDGRVLAFAQQDSDGYTIYVENGAPKIAAVANIVHELTHIWQYINWDKKKIKSHYGAENELKIYEGMAKWTEIQYLYFLNEVSYARRQEIYTRMRNDAYGQGFILFANEYKLVPGPGYRQDSPFNKEWPLELN
jgi:hypothetical protein